MFQNVKICGGAAAVRVIIQKYHLSGLKQKVNFRFVGLKFKRKLNRYGVTVTNESRRMI